jgi:hypothetical protein
MDDQERLANDLRTQLIKLKVDTLKVQSVKMGLSMPGEDISARALKQIQESVIELSFEQLQKEIAHWTELSRKVASFKPPKKDN